MCHIRLIHMSQCSCNPHPHPHPHLHPSPHPHPHPHPHPGESLILSLRSDRWQINFSARDRRARDRWTDALAQCMPVGVLGDDNSVRVPRKRTSMAARQSELSETLTCGRILQRELAAAEAMLGCAQSQADQRVAAAVDRLRAGDLAGAIRRPAPSLHGRTHRLLLAPTPFSPPPRPSHLPSLLCAPASQAPPHVSARSSPSSRRCLDALSRRRHPLPRSCRT